MADAEGAYPQGTPCWLDMQADDQEAALAFYRGLFGWTGEPDPSSGGYAVLSLGDRPVAGIGPVMPGMPAKAASWTVYFAVDDIEATARRITANGGTVYFGPGDVPDTGRMLVAADPAAAGFGLWQAEPFRGFGVRAELGATAWFELETPRGPASAEFYALVLGVEAPEMEEMQEGSYWVVTVNGAQAAGIWQAPEGKDAPQRAAHWTPYFLVADTDTMVRSAIAAGAQLVREPQDSPYGRLARLRDPLGAEFSVIAAPAA